MSAATAIRPLRWWDIPAAHALETELFPVDAWSEATFWSELAGEEMVHAQVFNKIRERVVSDDSFQVQIGTDLEFLKKFVNRAKELIKKVETDISEAEAYNLCAQIEGELDEASFIDRIQIQDDMLSRKLARVKADTRKHKIVLINYARGIK